MDILKLLDLLFAIIMVLGRKTTKNKTSPSISEIIKVRKERRAAANKPTAA
jgi:hypothetical protein